MAIVIRRAEREDCPRIMELVGELALYEKAPEQVTVSLEHFVESGFGERPVWWAFVAEEIAEEVAEEVAEETYEKDEVGRSGGNGESRNGKNSEAKSIISASIDNKSAGTGKSTVMDGKAAKGGRVVGFALWYIRYSTWKGQRMYLEDFYVEPRMRRSGIGAMLFERLVRQALESNLNGVVWQALDWNEPALDFYRKYGAKFDYEWVNCSLEFKN